MSVALRSEPADGTDFAFDGDLGAFRLDDDADPTLPDERSLADLAPGVYIVSAATAPGWGLGDIVTTAAPA